MTKKDGFTLEIEATRLKELLVAVRPAIPTKAVMPVLSGVLISGTEHGVEFSATDLNVALTVKDSDVSAEGRVLVSFGRLFDIASKMKSGKISFNETAERVTVKAGAVRYSLRKLNAEEFPAFPEIEVSQSITVDGPALAKALGQVAPACSLPDKDGGRSFLTGVHWIVENGTLTLLGTDTFRMSIRTLPVANGAEAKATIPAVSLDMLAKLLGEGEVTVGLGAMQARISSPRCVLVTRLIEQDYPDWRDRLPSAETLVYGFTVGREALIEAIEQADVVGDRGDMKLRTPVRIKGADVVTLTSRPKDGDEAEVELPQEWDGEPLEIGANPDWLLATLKSRTEERVSIRFVNAGTPISVGGDDSGDQVVDSSHVTWVMPRKLD